MSRAWFWRPLGIARTTDTGAIRRAYAQRLKALDIDREADAYAELRDARDAALAWARNQDVAEDVPVPEEPGEAPPAGDHWPYAAPLLGRGEDPAAVRIAAPPELHPALRPLSPPRATSGRLVDLPAPGLDGFAVPTAAGGVADAPLVQPEGRYEVDLHDLLYANGEDDETPLTEAETAAALRWQRLILRDAALGTVSAHDAIETWLAERLAGAWPRSAPLLAEASDAFGWDREAGQLSERPAPAFLSARLKGMRFLERVQLRTHPLHTAWTELRRPGRSNWFGRVGQSRADIHKLLSGIRKNFPELEHHLDPQRVASWESGARAEGAPGSPWPVWIILVLVAQVLLAIGRCSGPDPAISFEDKPPAGYESRSDLAISGNLRPKLDEAAHEIFGADTNYLKVTRLETELALTIRANLAYSTGPSDSAAQGLQRAISVVRQRSYIAGQTGDAPVLREAMRLRLDLLRAARKKDSAACMLLLRSNLLDAGVMVPEAVRQRERTFARDLLLADKLGPSAPLPPSKHSASIPGTVIGRIMRETDLGEAKVRELLQGKGSDGELCAASTALLGAALDLPAAQRDAILRVL